MKKEYSGFMAEGQEEQAPHKFSRVPDIKTARQNLAQKRDEKQIQLMQEALKRESHLKSTSVTSVEDNTEVEYNPIKVRAEVFKLIAEFSKQRGGRTWYKERRFDKMPETLRKFNSSIGPLLRGNTSLRELLIPVPSKLRELESNGEYDSESIQTLLSNYKFYNDYNGEIKSLMHILNRVFKDITVDGLQSLTSEEVKQHSGWMGTRHIGTETAVFYQRAFRPVKP